MFNISPENESTLFRLSVGANILVFNGVVFSVVCDVSVDSMGHVVTSLISKICRLSHLICVRAFIYRGEYA